jgi:hypothetical protein
MFALSHAGMDCVKSNHFVHNLVVNDYVYRTSTSYHLILSGYETLLLLIKK